MSCAQFAFWIVSDDPADRKRAEGHAAGCPKCAGIMQGHRWLADQTAVWRASDAAPPGLEKRIRVALGTELDHPGRASDVPRSGLQRWSLLWGALAASFLVGAVLGLFQFRLAPRAPEQAERLLVADALKAAEAHERDETRKVARLEAAAAPVLARAQDSSLASHKAARLFQYRDRLAFLDATIADVQSFVARNPGHVGARNVLLAAYRDKSTVLREIVALEETS